MTEWLVANGDRAWRSWRVVLVPACSSGRRAGDPDAQARSGPRGSTGRRSSASGRARRSCSRSRPPASGRCATRAKGLPEGLTARPGDRPDQRPAAQARALHDVVFEASNARGTASRPFRIVCGDTLALTPHMGWNSWYVWENHVTDKIMRDAADAMVSTRHDRSRLHVREHRRLLGREAGRNDPELGGEPARSREGRVNPNSRFPDMKALTDYIHAKGLKAGIYTSPGPLTCGGHVGAYQHEEQDVRQFVDWGFDFLKYDWCSYGQLVPEPGPGGAREAVPADGRHPQAAAARHRLEPVPVRHGRRLGVGQGGRRPELADRRRLGRVASRAFPRPSSATASTSTPRRTCTSSAGRAAGTTPTTCCWAT